MTGMQRAKRFVFGWISVFIVMRSRPLIFCFFFFNDTATTEIYTLSLHDALPIFGTKANRLHLLSCFVYVVLPDPDKPQTMMSVGLLWHLPVIWSAFRAEAPSVSSALVTMEG